MKEEKNLIKIGANGRIKLPQEIINDLELKPGDSIKITSGTEDSFFIEKATE